MNLFTSFQSLLTALAAIVSLMIASPQQAVAASDWGDSSSSVLAGKAWGAMGGQKYDDSLDYINRCLELYGDKAKEMQAALPARPAGEAKETTAGRWALNDCATCLFIKGEVLAKKGDKAGAKTAYAQLVKEMKDGACWDPKGWFWFPADAAKTKLVELEFDAK